VLKGLAVLLFLSVLFLPARYVGGIYGYLPGLTVLMLLILSLIHLLIVKRSLSFETEGSDSVCQRGETVRVVLKIRNRSVFTSPKAKACLAISGSFGGELPASWRTFPLPGKSETEIPLDLSVRHLGVYTFGIGQLQVYDLTGLFSVALRQERMFQVTALPNIYPMEEIRLEDRLVTENRNISKSAVSDGFDHTGVREYALGDPMKRIHWKLSAHSSVYMTRVAESSRKNDLTIVIDFVTTKEQKKQDSIYDRLVETALSLAEQARKRDAECVLLFAGCDGEINRVIHKGEQDYENLVRVMPLFGTEPSSELPDGQEILIRESHFGNRSSNILICTSRITDDLIQQLISIKRQQRNPGLYCIVQNQRDRDSLSAQMEVLENSGIGWHFIADEDAPEK
jgi:Uncharacterized conserved protein (some members contain a von Willebrand factor type A (vWA) domain)